jgi:alanine dehydrogenase
MIVGVPAEIKDNEYRIAMTPGGVRQVVDAGHRVWVETGAGAGSGFADADFAAAGAEIVATGAEAWRADLVVKVKEPLPSEYGFLRADLVLFTYLHLAAAPELTRAMVESGVVGIAYETVQAEDGSLPLLTPMSEVAGRMAVQVGAHYLQKESGGRGQLLGGVPGVLPGTVVVIGGGTVGTEAAKMALGLGAEVLLLDVNLERLRYLDEVLGGRFMTLASNTLNIAASVARADLLIGAVLIAGAKAPMLVTRDMIGTMPAGSVVVDVAVDQGGCIETTHPTTHSAPTFVVDGVVHYCVANMPGAVPRTSTYALGNATSRYVVKLANLGADEALRRDPALARGANIVRGRVTYRAVADAFGLEYSPLAAVIS